MNTIISAKLVFNEFLQEPDSVYITYSQGPIKHVPFDTANNSYRQYLAWLAEGNEPLPADN